MSDDLERSIPSTKGEGPSAAFVASLRERVVAESSGAQSPDQAPGSTPITEVDFLPPKENEMSNLRMALIGLAAAAIVVAGFVSFGIGDDSDNEQIGDLPEVTTSTTAAPTTTTTEPLFGPLLPPGFFKVAIEGTVDVNMAEGQLINGTGTGTFVVTEGAESLGCDSGTIEEVYSIAAELTRVMTCTSPANAGTITVIVRGTVQQDFSTWEIVEVTGDFTGLSAPLFIDEGYRGRSVVEDTFNPGGEWVWEPVSDYTDRIHGTPTFDQP